MKNKFILALLLILSLTFAVLAACDETPENKQYTVTFAGEGVSIAPQKVNSGSNAVEPKDPERAGYTFKYWYTTDESVPFDFTTQISADITLNAKWEKDGDPEPDIDPTEMTGSGTKEDPYVLYSALHLVNLATLFKTDYDGYGSAYYKLGADIDLNGISYTSIGTLDKPFTGSFDGDGHSIKNLSFDRLIRSDGQYFFGLFAATEKAIISNLSVIDIAYDVQSYRDSEETKVYIGAVAGYAALTNFTNVSVTGNVNTFLMASNGAEIGGLAGRQENAGDSENAYIAYTQNCFVNVQTGISEQDGDVGSLQKAYVGGLFGIIYNQNSSQALINNAVHGKICGGQFVGGMVGYVNDLVSVIDCFSGADVEGTSTEVCYVGGIIGGAMGDNAVLDCVSVGSVKAVPAAPNTFGYKSYAGGIVGYAAADDYEYYYDAGTAVVNCYFAVKATGADNINNVGNNSYAAGYLRKLDNLVKLGNWHANCWLSDSDAVRPSSATANSITDKYVLTLENGETSSTVNKPVNSSTGYSLVGLPDELPAHDSNVFWNWQIGGNVIYRYYVPVCKDMTLTAKWQDVSGIANDYAGTGTLHSTVDAGSIVLFDDGSLQWITDSVITGTYKYDGAHFLMSLNNEMGNVGGIINGTKLTFLVDAGMSGTVEYSFEVYTPSIIGEYISEAGNLLTFAGTDRVSYENSNVGGGEYFAGKYTVVNATTLTTAFKRLDEYGVEISQVVIESDGSLTLHYTENGTAKTEKFSKLGAVDYSDEGFVGEYRYVSITSYSSASHMTMRFDADGTTHICSEYSEVIGRYYYIVGSKTLKVISEGHVSNLIYDEDKDIIYGVINRGGSADRPNVLTRASLGEQTAYTNYEYNYKGVDYDFVFIFSVGGANYVFVNAEFRPEVSVTEELGVSKDVTVDGIKYRVFQSNDKHVVYELKTVNEEEGDYTIGNKSIHLDGIETATVAGSDYYYVAHKSDNLVDIIFGEEIITFNWQSAQANGGVAVQLTPDAYAGVWYQAGKYENDNGEQLINPYLHMLVFDGFGHAAIFYMPFGVDPYRLNWSPWGTYEVTPYGVSATFNEYHADYKFLFYYDKKVAYTPDYDGYSTYVAKGYTGETTPPVFPSDKLGSYVSGSGDSQLVFNIRADMSGTYDGNPIYDVFYDGLDKLFFSCDKLLYEFAFTQSGGSLKVVGSSDPAIEFIPSKDVVLDKIPVALCGMWTGSFSGYGASERDNRGFSIERDGTVRYYTNVSEGTYTTVSNVVYDSAALTITFTDANGLTWTLTYNTEEKTFAAEGRDGEEGRTFSAILSKQSA